MGCIEKSSKAGMGSPASELFLEGSVFILKFFHSCYNRRSNRKAYMGGRLISRKGGDASGGIPSIDANDFVRDSGCVDSIFPQKEIGRPGQRMRSYFNG